VRDDANGPNPTFAPWPNAAVQLHQTSRSSIVQHFRGAKVGSADEPALLAAVANDFFTHPASTYRLF